MFERRGPVQLCCCTRWAADCSDYSGISGRSAFGARDSGLKHIAPPCVAPQQERCRQRCSGGQVVMGGRDGGGSDAGGSGGNAGGSARRQHQPRTRATAAAAAAGAHTRATARKRRTADARATSLGFIVSGYLSPAPGWPVGRCRHLVCLLCSSQAHKN